MARVNDAEGIQEVTIQLACSLPISSWTWLITTTITSSPLFSRVSHVQSALFALAAARIVRAWNQTGQKFAGEPDIVKTFLHTNPTLLWVLVTVTYLWIHRRVVNGFSNLPSAINVAGTTGLVLAAFTFKLAFTYEDAPELVVGFAKNIIDVTQGPTLISRARAVFLGLAIATVVIIYILFSKTVMIVKSNGMIHAVPLTSEW